MSCSTAVIPHAYPGELESEMEPLQVLATFAVCAIPILIAFKGQREAD